MHLARVEIPWRFSRNPYDIHRALWSLFPCTTSETRESPGDSRRGFLFRVESNEPGRSACVLSQAQRRAGPSTKEALVVGQREFNPQPRQGQRLAFLLTGNPIKTIADRERKRPGKDGYLKRCRVPLIDEDEQRDWLKRKLEPAATVEAVTAHKHPPLFFRKGSRVGRVQLVTFEGMLAVAEPDALSSLLETGVGPAKAFGCGLLLVRRA